MPCLCPRRWQETVFEHVGYLAPPTRGAALDDVVVPEERGQEWQGDQTPQHLGMFPLCWPEVVHRTAKTESLPRVIDLSALWKNFAAHVGQVLPGLNVRQGAVPLLHRPDAASARDHLPRRGARKRIAESAHGHGLKVRAASAGANPPGGLVLWF